MTHKHAFKSLSCSQPFCMEGGGGEYVQKTDPNWTYIRLQSEFRPTRPHSWLEVPSALWYPLSSIAEPANTAQSGLCPADQGKARQRYTW
jgi:hypothetical protein